MAIREVSIEGYLKSSVEGAGGLCIKLSPMGLRGIPDRLIVLAGPRVIFAEVKKPRGGIISKMQHWWRGKLVALGCEHRFILTRADVDYLIGEHYEKVERE